MAKKYRFKKTKKSAMDYMLAALVLVLVAFGVIMVFSASYYYSINTTGSAYSFLIKDGFYAVTGFALMLFMTFFDYGRLRAAAWPMLIISLVLLCLLFTPLGVTINYATRWIGVGKITFMPGEFAKIAVIIFVSWFFSRDQRLILSFSRGIAPMIGLCGIYGLLVMLQPNMSTAITIVGIVFGIMFMAGMQWIWIIGGGALGVAAGALLIFSDQDGYRLKRVTSFMNPFADRLGEGYQVVQSLLALGSSGFFGVGLGKSIQKNLYLPEPQNDFILAIIGEELGFLGILILLTVYILLIWRGFHIALNAKDMFGTLLAGGITFMIAIQVIMNVAVATSSMPPTGVTLPFVSYGGNALWLFMGSAGILLNISRNQKIQEEDIE